MIKPFAKPHIVPFKPKPTERPRVGGRMSIVAAISSGVGTVLCADSQETVGSYAKRQVEKVKCNKGKDAEYGVAIGAAGSGHYADMLTFDLLYSIQTAYPNYDPERIIEFLQQKLSAFYAAHSLPRGEDAAVIELLIVLQPRRGVGFPLTLHLLETAVNVLGSPSVHGGYFKCIGIGRYLADYILDCAFEELSDDKHYLISVAAYMLKEVRENIEGCGKGSTIWYFGDDGLLERVSYAYVDALENMTDEINSSMRDLFSFVMDSSTEENFHLIEQELSQLRARQKDAYNNYVKERAKWEARRSEEKVG